MELERGVWPNNLKLVKPAIKNLFYKGNIDLLKNNSPKLAIVGSRRMTDYGARTIKKWVGTFINSGVVIVSGFMYGVDQAAHKECLECGGKTIAVLGWGIDRKVSGDDEYLYRKILEKDSLIVSEYANDFPGKGWTFPERNRIVAGMSDAVLIIEAAESSGSLITAKLASKFGKPLMAVPGRVDSVVARGTNSIIKNGEATLVTQAEDVLEVMGLIHSNIKKVSVNSDPILVSIENEGKTVDEIARILKLDVRDIGQKLTILTLQGEIEEINGVYFRR